MVDGRKKKKRKRGKKVDSRGLGKEGEEGEGGRWL